MDQAQFVQSVIPQLQMSVGHVVPQMLYHYTDANALMNIIRSKELWLSHSDFLNDPTEIRYGLNLIEDILASSLTQSQDERDLLDAVKQHIKIQETRQKYVLSLSTNSDSLVLWSNYAKSDGYAIGFDATSLLQQFALFAQSSALLAFSYAGNVIYNRLEQRAALENTIQLVLDSFRKFGKPLVRDGSFNDLCLNIAIALSLKATLFKSEHFKHEEEYRVVTIQYVDQVRPTPIHFRNANGLILPHIKVPLNHVRLNPFQVSMNDVLDPVKEVLIGPKNNMDNAEKGIRMFLDERDLTTVQIRKSAIRIR